MLGGGFDIDLFGGGVVLHIRKHTWECSQQTREELLGELTGVDAGAGGRDAKLRLDELWDEGDEGGHDGALRRVGQTDEQEGDVAEDPHGCFGQV